MKAFVLAVLITLIMFVLHEGGHALMAKALGYEVAASLNHVKTLGGANSEAHSMLITAAGPAVTFILGLIGVVLATRGQALGVTLVGTAFLIRARAAVVSLNNPNDEMRISLDLGLGAWTLPALVSGLLLGMLIYAIRKARPGIAYLVLTWLGFSVMITAIVFGESALPTLTF